MQIIPFSSQDYVQLRDRNKQKIEDFYLTEAYKEWENETVETINKYLKLAATRGYKDLLSIDVDPPSCINNLDNPLSLIVNLVNIYIPAGYNVKSHYEFILSENSRKRYVGHKKRDSLTLIFDITSL